MFNLFSSKSKLGIDIGTSAIKIVEVGKKSNRSELLNYGIFELKGLNDSPGSHSANQSILKLPDDEIVWGIKEIIKKANIKSKDVVASIPSFSTFSTVVEMSYLSEGDFEKVIPLEAKKYIPLPIDDVVLDWSIIGIMGKEGLSVTEPNKKDSKTPTKPTNVEVFLAAVPKSETARYQAIMKKSGLNLKALELENSSLIRALLGNDLSPTAIVNIGGRSTSILVVNKGYERVSHNYEVGGFEITKSISKSLKISIEKAEELKRQFGLKPIDENVVNEAMTSLVDMMVFETNKTITNYEKSSGQQIPSIIITGGLTNMPNFMEYFKNKIGREVFQSNIFNRIIYSKSLEPAVPELVNIFPVALGLGMRDI